MRENIFYFCGHQTQSYIRLMSALIFLIILFLTFLVFVIPKALKYYYTLAVLIGGVVLTSYVGI